MQAQLIFNLPEDQHDHAYALSGLDSLLVIHDVLDEIRSSLRYEAGELVKWKNDEGQTCYAEPHTLERVADFIHQRMQYRNLPELV